MISVELQEAIDSLEIQDVYVREQIGNCVGDFDPKYSVELDRLVVQQMHVVKTANVVELSDEGKTQLLRVFLRLGARWADPDEDNEELSVRALIEAEFVVEYEITRELEQASIDEFCLRNVSYHVWPYWRELLNSQCTRMHLPALTLPTMQLAHNRHQQVDALSSAKEVAEE